MKSFFGALMLGCGILIAGISGLCALLFIGGALFESSAGGGANQMSILPGVLLVAAVPLAIGIGLIFGGRAVVRDADAEARGKPYESAFKPTAPDSLPQPPSPVPPAADRDPLP